MRHLRKILFYSFVLLYLILCPLIIMYAFGYILRPGAENGIVKTGLIHLATTPPGATIYVDNKRYTQKTPATIKEMLPGDYEVKVFLNKYQVWQDVLNVQENIATVLDKILLAPNEWKKIELSRERFEDLIPVAGGTFFILTNGSLVSDYFSYNWKKDKLSPLFPDSFLFRSAKVLSYFMVEDSPAVIFYIDSSEGKRFIWLEQRGDEILIKDITNLFPLEPLQVKWDFSEYVDSIFSLQNGYINRLDIISGAMYPKYLESIRAFGVFNKKIYIIKDLYTLMRMDYDKKGLEILLSDPILGKFLFGTKGLFQIKPLSENILIFLGEKGELRSNCRPYRFVDRGVLGIEFHRASKRLALWQKSMFGVLDFSPTESQEIDVKKEPRGTWLYKNGKNITQAFWAQDGAYLLARDANEVLLFDLLKRKVSAPISVVSVRKDTSVYFSDVSGKLYYIDKDTSKLYACEIIPKNQGLFFSLPGRSKQVKELENK